MAGFFVSGVWWTRVCGQLGQSLINRSVPNFPQLNKHGCASLAYQLPPHAPGMTLQTSSRAIFLSKSDTVVPVKFVDRESSMAKPAARITDPTSCPMPGHGSKAIASGSPDVFFDGLAAARKGDTCTCGSALASEVSGTVLINGKNAALVGTVGTSWRCRDRRFGYGHHRKLPYPCPLYSSYAHGHSRQLDRL